MFNCSGYIENNFIHKHKGKMKLLKIDSVNKISLSIQHMIIISIHRDGYIMVNGVHTADKYLSSLLNSYRMAEPVAVADLVVDKYCPMERVNYVLISLRKAHFFHIIFVAKVNNRSGRISNSEF